MDVELRHLRLVHALARYGTFEQAARALGISQPAVSRGLQTLERRLGGRLFDRGGPGGAQPTPLGRILLERGEPLVREHRELLRELRLTQGLAVGSLVVAAAYFPAAVSVHRAIGSLVARHPGIHVRVESGNWRVCTEAVLARSADLAVADLLLAASHPQLDVESVGRHRFVFVCREGHPLLALEDVTEAHLFSYPWVATRGPIRMAKQFPPEPFAAGRIEAATGEFVPAVLTPDLRASYDIVRNSEALGVAIDPSTTGYPLASGLAQVGFRPAWAQLDYGFVTLKGRTPSPAAAAFKDEVRHIEAAFAADGAARAEGGGRARTP